MGSSSSGSHLPLSCLCPGHMVKAAAKRGAMKAAAMKNTALSQSAVAAAAAETTGLKPKSVKVVLGAVVDIAAKELKKNGSFKLAGVLNMKLKVKPAVPARKGVNPFTKEPCVFKAKPKSQTVRVLPLKKFKQSLN